LDDESEHKITDIVAEDEVHLENTESGETKRHDKSNITLVSSKKKRVVFQKSDQDEMEAVQMDVE